MHSESDFKNLDTTSEQLLTEWQGTGIQCRVIRSHRRPRSHSRLTPIVATGIAVLTVLGVVSVSEPRTSQSTMAADVIHGTISDARVQSDLDERLTHIDDPITRATRVPRITQKPVPVVQRPRWVSPLKSYRITSCYGPRWGRTHKGIDFAAPYGQPIFAVGSGVIVQAGWRFSGMGYSVVIDHGNGQMTIYAHASRVLVRTGQRVSAGDRVALVGSTGHSTGNHLHFGLAKTRTLSSLFDHIVNPASWLEARGISTGFCA